MKKPLRRLLAGLTIATAAATGSLTATGTATAAPTGDTAWGAPDPGHDTTNDTAWGTPPTDDDNAVGGGATVTPFDTAWG